MNSAAPPHNAIEEFGRLFGSEPRLFRAPGRINLIGEHTDYNDGYVMPAAIEFATWIAAEPRSDRRIIARSLAFRSTAEINLDAQVSGAEPQWSKLVRGVAAALQKIGVRVPGANIVIEGNVPMGAGLSSSASVEVALAVAFANLAGANVSSTELALAAQRAEIESTGARVGIMDQFVSANGQAGKVLMLDCRSLKYEVEPFPADLQLVVCNTMIKHSIAGGEYNARRAQCEEGVSILRKSLGNVSALRDVSLDQLEQHKAELPQVVYRRCRHVITENSRVLEMANALKADDEPSMSKLMHASHVSLRDDYEVSCPELDAMVDAAADAPGAVGSRMTGGGFGGCTVNLVRRGFAERFVENVSAAYQRATGIVPETYITGTTDGAGPVSIRSLNQETA